MTRSSILVVVLGMLACACARREVVVEPSRVHYLQDREWRISSVPSQGQAPAPTDAAAAR